MPAEEKSSTKNISNLELLLTTLKVFVNILEDESIDMTGSSVDHISFTTWADVIGDWWNDIDDNIGDAVGFDQKSKKLFALRARLTKILKKSRVKNSLLDPESRNLQETRGCETLVS